MICGECYSTAVDYKRFVSDNDKGYIELLYCYDCGKMFTLDEAIKLKREYILNATSKK